ncbi:MAG: hypothetical protein PF795_03945 [Kiritimatiellae bacterium]|nr:hypothetical protein [Kiritimatiellia bacterium]
MNRPPIPTGSRILLAEQAKAEIGKAWLTQTGFGYKSFFLNGPSSVRFDFSTLTLETGYYRIGLIVRTGTRWDNAIGQIQHYRLHLNSSSKDEKVTIENLSTLIEPEFDPVMDSGEPDSWANWYGSIQPNRPILLQGDETLLFENLENHGGVLALWIQPVHPLNSVTIDLTVPAPQHAFIEDTQPTVDLTMRLPEGLPPLEAQIQVEWLDMLTDTAHTSQEPLGLRPGEHQQQTLTRSVPPGVYRVTVSLVDENGATIRNPSSARCFLAYAPTRMAKDLPEDWPLAVHVNPEIPPLPGFKWYRYFALWSETNPAHGVYDWDEIDKVYKAVKEEGGLLMIASDGSPLWTSSKEKEGMNWMKNATAHPPDDWETLQTYLKKLVERYQDDSGTLAALELVNEPNTQARWLGTTEDMIEMAAIFREVASSSAHPIQIVGLSISAGHHIAFVKEQIQAGLLEHIDAISAHFYEELMSFEADTPINNLPRHVQMLEEPMRSAGFDLPMINTESGIGFANREQDRLITQTELNARAEAHSDFKPAEPWLIGKNWRDVSERRAAAGYVSGTVTLMASDVRPSF